MPSVARIAITLHTKTMVVGATMATIGYAMAVVTITIVGQKIVAHT